ncbi:helix-turn-helix transcriptional regulator [Novosphingobium ginsenosidimutans]|uniref:Helix-turn-helix transcriptional regulator n=2 Tax=Novosphingobium ginsenosidimutans TaxID=1176536 RepID=A0A5B8S676_9SPHN|nr:helix-turn-helix transcriptional regulator [Novosphingobium ginsenosidimutans]QEA16923.1 helix-turn-helix transcriptional regulator [Novosphingobium ginsenosidimutans]
MEPQIRPMPEPVVLPQLTSKQREVMALVADNRTSKEIAGLLGISESAVNQRIELIRGRLGGIPRGEMARLYRQEFAREQTIAATFPPTWNKIQVQSGTSTGQSNGVEGPSSSPAAQKQPRLPGSGSQPSHSLLPDGLAWLDREEPSAAILRSLLMAILVVAGMAAAATVTGLLGFMSGG